jgi:hypothetical protein
MPVRFSFSALLRPLALVAGKRYPSSLNPGNGWAIPNTSAAIISDDLK